jgi:hypothetical protein
MDCFAALAMTEAFKALALIGRRVSMSNDFGNEVDEILEPRSEITLSTYFGMSTEIGGANGFVAPQFVGLATEHDAAGLQHIAVVGDR